MLVFLFSSFAIRAVGEAAQSIIAEVRRQYAKLPRINDIIQFPKDFKPDYGTCVDIVTKAALRKMIVPGLLVVLMPVAVGLIFKILYVDDNNPVDRGGSRGCPVDGRNHRRHPDGSVLQQRWWRLGQCQEVH